MNYFYTIFLLFLSLLSFGQEREISGRVIDAKTSEPLPGVSVVLVGSSIGVATDIEGSWKLKVSDKSEIIFSFVGMRSYTLLVDQRDTYLIMLKSDAEQIDEVMVVAYGTAKKESFTGSAEVVSAKRLKQRSVANVTKSLDGVVAGVMSTSGSGRPGSGSAIIIRGIGSINASATPLYVVDGVPYEGSTSALNPQDIETMTILKDASASALYGSRGANGVVVVTTKKGQDGKSSMSFKASVGLIKRALPEYEMMNEQEFMEANYDYTRFNLMSAGLSESQANLAAMTRYMDNLGGEQYNPFTISSDKLINPSSGKMVSGAELKWQDNWLDKVMASRPIRREYVLSARGGNNKTRYYLSFGYLDEEGLAVRSGFERYSARVNVESKLNEYCKIGLSSSFALTKSANIPSSGSSASNVWYSAQTIAPIYPLYVRDASTGDLVLKDGNPQYDYGNQRPYLQRFNSVALLFEDQAGSKDENTSMRGFFDLSGENLDQLSFLKDFRFVLNLGMDYSNASDHQFYNPFSGNAVNSQGNMTKIWSRLFSYTTNQLLYYNKKFDNSALDIMLGHEYYDREMSDLIGSRTGFIFGDSEELGEGSTVKNSNSSTNRYRLVSYLSQVNYNINDTYYLSASFRKDGSSRFHTSNRWGSFWSIGCSCRLSQMAALKKFDWLNNLTAKVSYGEQGNDAVGAYNAWQRTYKYGYSNGYRPGLLASQLENKNLKWEKSGNFNIGIESKMFASRLSLSVEYFLKKTSDMLLFRELPFSSGYSGIYENVGDMQNKGVDVTIGITPVKTSDLSWNTTLLASCYRNRVTALADDTPIRQGAMIIKVGEPIYSYYLPESAGVSEDTGDQLYWGYNDKNERVKMNTPQYEAYKVMGSREPKFHGSFSNQINYKSFDISILLTYSVGGKVLDSNYATIMGSDTFGRNWHKDMNRRWRNKGDKTDIPRLENGYLIQATDRNLFDASYLGFKSLGIGYTFSLGSNRSNGKTLRIGVIGDNIHTFTSLKGMDPQYNFTGGQSYSYAPTSSWNFNIDLNF